MSVGGSKVGDAGGLSVVAAGRPLGLRRHLAAVLAVDVAGYTKLMEADEAAVHSELMFLMSDLVSPTISRHQGRIVKSTGDGFLASFDTAEDGITCAIELQERLSIRGERFPPQRRILFRMGLNYCDTIVEDFDIFGEGVNIAARLQSYAEPGDIVVEAATFELGRAVLAQQTTFDLGDLYLKNISKPVKARGVRIGSLRGPAIPVRSPASEAKPSIAVLPLRYEAPDALLADGVVAEIIHSLSALKQLFVISWTSILHYRGRVLDPKVVGGELGVGYVLTGSLTRRDGCLYVATELVEASTGRLLRSDRFEEQESGRFSELPARISLAAIRIVAPEVMEWELRRGMRKHPESRNAYDLVLQALHFLYRMDFESHSRARGLLQAAIALDPEYAGAYSYTAYWYIFRVGEGWTSDQDADAAEAARLAKAAIDRDSNDALALAIFGHVQAFLLRSFDAADVILNRAIDVGPSSAVAWSMSSLNRGYLGDGKGAVERAEQGIRLSPLDAHIFLHEGILAQAHYINGDLPAAIAWAQKAATRKSTAMFNLRILAASLAALGRRDEAAAAAREILKHQPGFRLGAYQARCPFRDVTLVTWLERLGMAGLPH